MEYVEWLASAEYYYGLPLSDDNERNRLLESSVNHYRIVLDNSTDRKLCDKALHGIVLTLHFLGRHVEAKDWAMKQEDETKRDDMLCWCLEGDEKVRHTDGCGKSARQFSVLPDAPAAIGHVVRRR